MHILGVFVSLLIGPFRNIVKVDCNSWFREDLLKENQILKDNVRNVTSIIKRNIETKFEDSALEQIKLLNNQLDWLRKNLKNE